MKKTASRGSFVEGFNPVPSSEEENSDAEVDYEEKIVKCTKGSKKKAITRTTVGCKSTKETGSKDLDDNEEKVKRKKPNGTSMKSTAKIKRGTARSRLTGIKVRSHICDHKKRPFAGIDIASSLSELVRKCYILN